MAKKITVPESLDAPYVPDESLSSGELEAIRADARELALSMFGEDDSISPENLAKAKWLAAAVQALDERSTAAKQAEEEAQAEVAALRAQFGAGSEEGDGNENADAANTDAEPPADAPAETAEEKPPVLVAGAGKITAAGMAASAPKPVVTRRTNPVTITAAADVPGFSAGQTIDLDQIGRAFIARTKSFGGRGKTSVGIASINVPADDEALVASGGRATDDIADIDDAVAAALDDSRLNGGNLVAAGGWCAPSETWYDLLNLTTNDGLLDLPAVTVTRGGVRFATGPDFTAVYTSGGLFTQTEAQNIANTAKPVVDIPCPPFTEVRMNADGMYFTSGILSEKAYPEGVSDFIAKALTAFEHYQSGKKIADIISNSTLVDYTAATAVATGAFSTDLLDTVEFQAVDMRYRGRLSLTAPVEVKMPFFAKAILRSDLAKRNGVDNYINVSDAEIDQFFAVRGVTVTYVYDWQDAVVGNPTVATIGGATPGRSWPTTMNFIIYPSGTWVGANSDVIELNGVYDSALLAQNKAVQLFVERGRLTIKKGFDSRNVKIAVTPTGTTAAQTAVTLPTV